MGLFDVYPHEFLSILFWAVSFHHRSTPQPKSTTALLSPVLSLSLLLPIAPCSPPPPLSCSPSLPPPVLCTAMKVPLMRLIFGTVRYLPPRVSFYSVLGCVLPSQEHPSAKVHYCSSLSCAIVVPVAPYCSLLPDNVIPLQRRFGLPSDLVPFGVYPSVRLKVHQLSFILEMRPAHLRFTQGGKFCYSNQNDPFYSDTPSRMYQYEAHVRHYSMSTRGGHSGIIIYRQDSFPFLYRHPFPDPETRLQGVSRDAVI